MRVNQMKREHTSKKNLFRIEPGFWLLQLHSVWVLTRVIFNLLFTMTYQEVLKTMCKRLEELVEMVLWLVATCS